MTSSTREDVGRFHLVCVKSSMKFLRAGYANILLVIGAIFSGILWQVSAELGIGKYGAMVVAAGVFILFVWYYSTFVSRISEEDGVIHVTKAFTDMRLRVESIASIRISAIGLSHFAKITIERVGNEGTVRLRLIAPVTNVGGFASTVAALEEFAQRHSR